MADQTRTETGWETAPSLIDGAMTLELTPETCDLDYWLTEVAQGTLRGLVQGHRPDATTPAYMRSPGPLRNALISELGFRAIAEEKATRTLSTLVDVAPDIPTMEFYATQLIDEARHARVFRGHLIEMGVPEDQLFATIDEYCGKDVSEILVPLEDFSRPLREAGDFAGGVVMLTILVEGILAPAAELSERKWRVLDPAASGIERGAAIDEIRHLTVGSNIIKRHLEVHPTERQRLGELIDRGQQLWAGLPVVDMIVRREQLFQEGLEQYADLVGNYEIWPGRRLLDTTPMERMQQALTWSTEMQQTRLRYMGLVSP